MGTCSKVSQLAAGLEGGRQQQWVLCLGPELAPALALQVAGAPELVLEQDKESGSPT